MATTLINQLVAYYFSSQLPDMQWDTDSDALTVSLYGPSGGVNMLTVTLTAVGGKVKLWEVRETVERWLRNNGRSYIAMTVRWKTPDANSWTYSSTMGVIYCVDNINDNCSTWLENHFLTTAESKILPPDGATESLFFANPSNTALTPKAWVSYRLADGTVRGMFVPLTASFYQDAIRKIDYSVDGIRSQVETELETSVEVLAVSVRAGSRSMTHYKPGIPANAAFVFRNVFGVTEVAWLHAATTTKRKDGRKVANVARRLAVYDLDLEVSHEVESVPLPLETAQWLAQLVTSPRVWLADGTPVVITDGTSEVSDDNAVMNTVKFTWKRDDSRAEIGESATDINIFTQPPFGFQFD